MDQTAWVYVFVLLSALTGCVRLPASMPVLDGTSNAVEASFAELVIRQHKCASYIDAVATVKITSPKQSGTIEGNLLALPPGALKFIGVTPFGQPQLLFATTGETFQLVTVSDGKAYRGSVRSAKFTRYAPSGFDAKEIVLWLTGRFSLEAKALQQLEKDLDGNGFWLRFKKAGHDETCHILFDLQSRQIRRHIITDRLGRKMIDASYDSYQPVAGLDLACAVPGRINIDSLVGGTSMVILLEDILAPGQDPERDLSIAIPAGFVEEEVH